LERPGGGRLNPRRRPIPLCLVPAGAERSPGDPGISLLGNYVNGTAPRAKSRSSLEVASKEARPMKASVDGHIIAQSDDIVTCHGYRYFPQSVVRMDWLQKTEKTAGDHACPHGVQFYDVVVDGKRHERAAWQYERPRPEMAQVGGRFSFWQDVEVA
jgi:uncharacterized protein (DUF427 family)